MHADVFNTIVGSRQFQQKVHLSFSGGGFMGIYHVGVGQAFREFAPYICERRVLGASAGALAASCLVCNFPVDKAIQTITRATVHCRNLSLGPLHPRFNVYDIMRDDLYAYMPEDAHVHANGRLLVSLTYATTLKNKIVDHFDSRNELIDVLLASCFVPYMFGLIPPKINGVSCIDGGISCNVPVYDEYTITVSPFHDSRTVIRPSQGIAPPGRVCAPRPVVRLFRAFFAPAPSALEQLCRQGYADAIDFLQKNKLILCHHCITVADGREPKPLATGGAVVERPTTSAAEEDGEVEHALCKHCKRCNKLQRLSHKVQIPSILLDPMKEAAANEERASKQFPLKQLTAVRVVIVVIALLLFPLHVIVTILERVVKNWRYIHHWVVQSVQACGDAFVRIRVCPFLCGEKDSVRRLRHQAGAEVTQAPAQ